jgi:hypothetical protein
MRPFVFLSLILFPFLLSAAEEGIPSRFRPAATIGFNFNPSDFFLGFSGGIEDTEKKWGAKLSFDFRPYFGKVQIEEDQNVINQYYERKYLVSMDVEKRLFELKILGRNYSPFAAVRTGYLFGNYRGLRKAPEAFWIVSPVAGISLVTETAHWKLAYSRLNTRNIQIPADRIVFEVTFFINK